MGDGGDDKIDKEHDRGIGENLEGRIAEDGEKAAADAGNGKADRDLLGSVDGKLVGSFGHRIARKHGSGAWVWHDFESLDRTTAGTLAAPGLVAGPGGGVGSEVAERRGIARAGPAVPAGCPGFIPCSRRPRLAHAGRIPEPVTGAGT